MKQIKFKKIWVLLFFILLINNTDAQPTWLPCGNVKLDTAANNKAQLFLRNYQQRTAALPAMLIRVYFHILSLNDGSQAVAQIEQINSEFTSLLNSYSVDNICFMQMGVDYINSSSLDTNFNADTNSGSVFDPYQVPNCINIFYLQKIKGNNTACNPPCGYGGIALGGIPGTYLLIAQSNIGNINTISHEMGHCLGLLHTFDQANGYEKIDGSNGTTSADLVADTPADPYAYNNTTCFAAVNCVYTGTCTDPNNQSNFSPPYTNLMAYWNCAATSATTGQFARVNSFLATTPALINCESPYNLSLPSITVNGGNYLQSAINTLTTGFNSISLLNTTNAVLAAPKVILEPGFHAKPTNTNIILGKTRITTTNCY